MKRVLFVLLVAIGLVWAGQPSSETAAAQAAGQCTVAFAPTYVPSYTLAFAPDGTGVHPTNPTLNSKVGQVTVFMQYTSRQNRSACQGKGWEVSTPDPWIKLTQYGSTAAGSSSVSNAPGTTSNTVFIKPDANTGAARIGSVTLTVSNGAVLKPGTNDTIVVTQEGAK